MNESHLGRLTEAVAEHSRYIGIGLGEGALGPLGVEAPIKHEFDTRVNF
jgi:hypothetical protein